MASGATRGPWWLVLLVVGFGLITATSQGVLHGFAGVGEVVVLAGLCLGALSLYEKRKGRT